MNRKTITITRIGEGENVAFYTFIFEGEEQSELAKFKSTYRRSEFKEEYQDILLAISIIGDHTANKIHFRPCSALKDNVMALPGKEDEDLEVKAQRLKEDDLRVLRLYCIALTDSIVILGNGGIKSTETYNEDPILNEYVEILLAIDKKLSEKGFSNAGKELKGNLKFEIQWH